MAGARSLQTYGLTMPNVSGIDHAIGYAALANGSIDLKDAYSTDAKIAGERSHRAARRPALLSGIQSRLSLPAEIDPRAVAALNHFGRIDEAKMICAQRGRGADQELCPRRLALLSCLRLTAARRRPRSAATTWRAGSAGISNWPAFRSSSPSLIGLPLGIAASRGGALGQAILAIVGMIQTIPSLALLALLVPVPFLGISATTAIVALFLYGLLPIVRNTATGLQDISPALRDSAVALGLEPCARLRKIYLPLASRTILAGIKTSAVINIGTATLAALIGAGGLGEPILSGLNLNDNTTILEGAIPAALLALLVQGLFDLLDRVLIPRGLRLGS